MRHHTRPAIPATLFVLLLLSVARPAAACEAGQRAAGDGCVACDPGTYGTDGLTCSPCDPGHYAPFDSAIACPVCPPGQYQPNQGAIACLQCACLTPPGATTCACDMATAAPADLSTPDLSAPPDLITPDLSTPDLITLDLSTPDLSARDLSSYDLSTPDLSAADLAVLQNVAGGCNGCRVASAPRSPAPSLLFFAVLGLALCRRARRGGGVRRPRNR